MKIHLLIIYSFLCFAYNPQCVATSTCNSYNSTVGMCFSVTNNSTLTNTSYLVNFFGSSINGKYHYCPLVGTYCNDFNLPNTSTVNSYCQPLLQNGVACLSAYQCLGGVCVNGKCNTVQSSINMLCSVNSDCEYKLSCVKGLCQKPIAAGQPCSNLTLYGYYGMGMDQNECDYTQNYLCGYVGSANYSCVKLFSIADHSYVSNPLLCASMITNSISANGMAPGNCIANRATELPILQYNSGVKYSTCNSDSDCSYTYNGSTNYTYSGSCICTPFQNSPASYCKYGGGEAEIITDMTYYQKYWIPQYGLTYNVNALKYEYLLDLTARVWTINPLYCTSPQFYLNVTVAQPTTLSVIMFYAIVGAFFLIGIAGVIVVFLMC